MRKDLQNSCLKGGHMHSFNMILKMYITSQSNTLESLRLFGCYKGWLQLKYAIGKSTKDDDGGGDDDDSDGRRGSQNQMKGQT